MSGPGKWTAAKWLLNPGPRDGTGLALPQEKTAETSPKEMNPRLFLLYPLAEIATFILVGKAIGVAATLALVIASSLLGMTLLREAGLMTALRLERGREAPGKILAEGGTRMLAGLLLLIPGFLTDVAALAVLIPGVRKTIAGWFGSGKSARARSHEVIEGEYRRLDR
jgi:UPF0716 family protein affecting phage T7 exclusion